MEIIRSAEQKVIPWAGGTAIQMAIWPREETYGEQRFLWRMSAAAITKEQSIFTRLPDYRRFMGIREGAVLINHGNNVWLYMNPKMVATWDGAVPSFSRGTASNLNLMVRKDAADAAMQSVKTAPSYKGSLLREFFDMREAVQGNPMELCPPKREKSPVMTGNIFGLFVSSGDDIVLEAAKGDGGERFTLHSGDLVLWDLGDDWNYTRIVDCGESRLFGVWVMERK